MKSVLAQKLLLVCCVASSLAVGGCGSGEKRVPVVKVDAKLFLDDKPLGPAVISLSPEGVTDPKKALPPATGNVDKNGVIDLRTYKDTAGIVPGKYSVVLMPDPMKMGSSPSAEKASVEITSTTKTLDIKLTTPKKAPKAGAPL